MAFDIIDNTGKAYQLMWAERGYLLRLAAAPLLIQYLSFMMIDTLAWEDNFVRQAVVLLPANFAMGWMLSHFVRLIFLGQRWPFTPSGDKANDLIQLQKRAQGIMAGTVTYALIQVIMAGISQFIIIWEPLQVNVSEVETLTTYEMITVFFIFIIGLWAFRFLWLFVPAALDYPFSSFISKIRDYKTSIYILGAWLISVLPFFVMLTIIRAVLVGPYDVAGTDLPFFPMMIEALLITITAVVASLTSTAAISYGLAELIQKRSGK